MALIVPATAFVWVLQDAVQAVRVIFQPMAKRYGYHVALGGGVLNLGGSMKDLDLYFLPLRGTNKETGQPNVQNKDELVQALIRTLGDSTVMAGADKYYEVSHNGDPTKPFTLHIFPNHGKRIDVFIFG